VVGRRQALAQAEARIARARLALDRVRLMLADAGRALAETEIRAPFDGLVTDVSAVLGRRVTANEPLGKLIDPQGMEVAFRVSTAEFSRLIDAEGTLRPLPITAALGLGTRALALNGQLARAATMVGEGQTGRLLFARLDLPPDTVLRPGDFLTVGIAEPPLADVAVLPATAVTEDGRLLVLDADDRLVEIALPVLRRQGDTVMLGEAPEGARHVVTRLPTLGAGLKVRPIMPDAAPAAPDLVELTPERRAALIAAVEASTRMPPEARARILTSLRQDRVPREMVERLEARMGG
jgi:membrane fusion protein, multidrug efflux system